MPFSLPDSDVVSIIDAPPTPLAVPSPDEQFLVLLSYQPHPPISLLARPSLKLAGLRIDQALGARQRTRRFSGLSVLRISGLCHAPTKVITRHKIQPPHHINR